MADERKIVIELKVSGSDSESDNDALKDYEKENNDLVKKLQAIQNPFGVLENKLLSKATLGKTQLAKYFISNAKSVVKNGVMYHFTKYFNLTENYKSEQDLSNTMSVLSHVGTAWTSVLGGAIAGVKAGPYGAIIGAAIGVTAWSANTLIERAKAFDNENMQLSTMRIQSGYQQVRLGLVDDGRGTQN